MHVRDLQTDPILESRGSFGDFRGYLVVDQELFERPSEAGPQNVRGLTGILTYQIAQTWLFNLLLPAPWSFPPYDGSSHVCVLSGRLHSGDIPEY
jgi:hypothetical protein